MSDDDKKNRRLVRNMSINKHFLSHKDREKLQCQLYEGDGRNCHYCGIEEEDFLKIWRKFYKSRGQKLEIEHKDNNRKDFSLENLVLACALCNCAKSNKLT